MPSRCGVVPRPRARKSIASKTAAAERGNQQSIKLYENGASFRHLPFSAVFRRDTERSRESMTLAPSSGFARIAYPSSPNSVLQQLAVQLRFDVNHCPRARGGGGGGDRLPARGPGRDQCFSREHSHGGAPPPPWRLSTASPDPSTFDPRYAIETTRRTHLVMKT